MQMHLVLVHSSSQLGKFFSIADAWIGTENKNPHPFPPFKAPF